MRARNLPAMAAWFLNRVAHTTLAMLMGCGLVEGSDDKFLGPHSFRPSWRKAMEGFDGASPADNGTLKPILYTGSEISGSFGRGMMKKSELPVAIKVSCLGRWGLSEENMTSPRTICDSRGSLSGPEGSEKPIPAS